MGFGGGFWKTGPARSNGDPWHGERLCLMATVGDKGETGISGRTAPAALKIISVCALKGKDRKAGVTRGYVRGQERAAPVPAGARRQPEQTPHNSRGSQRRRAPSKQGPKISPKPPHHTQPQSCIRQDSFKKPCQISPEICGVRSLAERGLFGRGGGPEGPGSRRHRGPGWALPCPNSLGRPHNPGCSPARIPISQVWKPRPRESGGLLRVTQQRRPELPAVRLCSGVPHGSDPQLLKSKLQRKEDLILLFPNLAECGVRFKNSRNQSQERWDAADGTDVYPCVCVRARVSELCRNVGFICVYK